MIRDDGPFIWLDIIVERKKMVKVKVKDENGNVVEDKVEKFDGYDLLNTRFSKHAISLISPSMNGRRKLKTRTSFYDKTSDGFYTTKCTVEQLHQYTKPMSILGFQIKK